MKLTLCASLLNISSLIVELLSFSFSVYSFLFLLFCFVSSLLRIREMEKKALKIMKNISSCTKNKKINTLERF